MWMNHVNVLTSYQVLFTIFLVYNHPARCNQTANEKFNASIREHLEQDDQNVLNVKTLQKGGYARYRNISPSHQRDKNKDDSDFAHSDHIHHGRGFHQDQGYPINEYDEPLPYGYHGYQDYPHGHYGGHPGPNHVGFGHHHKFHDDHSIALKAVLWPVAGLALLGAAAALVTNPVLLQLGVVSGKRRRRDTEEIISGPQINLKLADLYKDQNTEPKQAKEKAYVNTIHRISKKSGAKLRSLRNLRNFPLKQMTVETLSRYPVKYNRHIDDGNISKVYVPVELKVRN